MRLTLELIGSACLFVVFVGLGAWGIQNQPAATDAASIAPSSKKNAAFTARFSHGKQLQSRPTSEL